MSHRIVIVDDAPLFRDILVQYCERELQCEVVGVADEVDEACELIGEHRPGLALLDVCLGQRNGFEVVDWVAGSCPGVRCVLMSGHCSDAMVMRAQRSAICGFIDKNHRGLEELRQAFGALLDGACHYSSTFAAAVELLRMDKTAYVKVLSEREQAVLGLVGHGLNDEAIGRHLGIAPATVENHRKHIRSKLGLNSNSGLIRFAIDCGLVQLTSKPSPSSAALHRATAQ